MPLVAALHAVIGLSVEQFVQGRYGPLGLAGLFVLAVGVKARNPTCCAIGAGILALILALPVL
jgi:hypothetical protein